MKPPERSRITTTRLVLAGLLLLFLGIPFLGSAFMAFLLTGSLAGGIPASMGILAGIFYLSGFQGAAVSAAAAGAFTVCIRLEKGLRTAAAVSAAAAVITAVASSGYDPGFMSLSSADLQPLAPFYQAAGFAAGEIQRLFDLLEYLAPGIGALQITGGTLLAAFLAASLMETRRGWERPGEDRFRLDIPLAWVLIGLLLACMFGNRLGSAGPDVLKMSRNALVFMTLPYCLLGASVTRDYLRAAPQMVVPAAITAVFAPPLAVAGLILLGILDTWFDFRRRIELRIERTKNEDSSR